MRLRSAATARRSREGTKRNDERTWWTKHVWTQVWGKTASIASGKPARPSTQHTRTSSTPRWLEFGEDLQPELGALGLLKPQAEDVALAVCVDADRQIAGEVAHGLAVADLDH